MSEPVCYVGGLRAPCAVTEGCRNERCTPPSVDYDALAHLCQTVIDVHAQVVMDTPEDRELHDRAVATFRARLAQLTRPIPPGSGHVE